MGKLKKSLKDAYDKIYAPFDNGDGDESQIVSNRRFFIPVIECLESGLKATIPVKGFSMLPFIRGRKDLVVLQRKDSYRKGDIVLFNNHGRTILHRIVRIEGDRVTIQGDGVPRNQEHVRLKDIHGKAVTILRDGKREVDPDSPWQRFRSKMWNGLKFMRKPLLYAYRLAPWNYVWLRKQ